MHPAPRDPYHQVAGTPYLTSPRLSILSENFILAPESGTIRKPRLILISVSRRFGYLRGPFSAT